MTGVEIINSVLRILEEEKKMNNLACHFLSFSAKIEYAKEVENQANFAEIQSKPFETFIPHHSIVCTFCWVGEIKKQENWFLSSFLLSLPWCSSFASQYPMNHSALPWNWMIYRKRHSSNSSTRKHCCSRRRIPIR